MNRLERLINLLAALLDTSRPLTADELSRRVPGYPDERNAFRRAFERDKEVLRELGVPIVVERIDDDPLNPVEGYQVRKETYYLQDPGLEPDELAAVHLAASTVQVEGAQGMPALWKLGGGSLASTVEPAPSPIAALPGAAHLAPIFGAISECRTIAFRYRGERREVEPHRLAFRNGHWYVSGRDRARDDDRSYRLDRVEGDVDVGAEAKAFVRPPVGGAPPPPWQMGDGEAVTARLLVDADQAAWAVGQLGEETVRERRDDGSLVMEVAVTNRAAFRSFVLGFLDHAELLGPADLRAELVDWLEALTAAGG